MKSSDITESVLVKSGLFTEEELKFARVILNLKSAGGENSSTRKWFRSLGARKNERLNLAVNKKISQILEGAGK